MKFWFMRDNHTFIRFPDKIEEVSDFIHEQDVKEPDFYKYGLLGARNSKDDSIGSIDFRAPSYSEFLHEVINFYRSIPEEQKGEITLLREELAACKQQIAEKDQLLDEVYNLLKRTIMTPKHHD